jgi:predicted dehydrogenase
MIRIGIIGMSTGNAHPYSWSAIINGVFDGSEIARVGYPAVAAYLEANKDTLGIDGASVTHVWTQDEKISASIAKTAGIGQVCARMEDMIGKVDAVILGRDDPEQHVAMARPFIEAGIPIFIDKPLAITTADLDYFSKAHAQGKFIMSCSSMRYAVECRAVKSELGTLGKPELVTAVCKKDWPKYGVHVLEGLVALLGDPVAEWVRHVGENDRHSVQIRFANGVDSMIHVFNDIVPVMQLSVFCQNGWRQIEIKNSYAMFRDNIIEFVRSVLDGKPRLSFDKTVNIIRILIGAEESLRQNGKKILL